MSPGRHGVVTPAGTRSTVRRSAAGTASVAAMPSRSLRLGLVVALVATGLGVAAVSQSAGASGPSVTSISASGHSYTPQSVNGATDDYHCTLVDPHVTRSRYIVSSQFFPNSPEVHHAILALVPVSLAGAARSADDHGKGWTCFGQPNLPVSATNGFTNSEWLTVWVPGRKLDPEPAGTGMLLPAGSLIVEQVHYNLLKGHRPVHASLRLDTVPASAHLAALTIQQAVDPPDVPCPTGVTGPLCDRAAAIADLGHRFGAGAVLETDVIEAMCGHDPSNPPVGVTTTCVHPADPGWKILRITPHMHLTGASFKVTLNPGTPGARTLVDVAHFNFDDQRFYDLKTPVVTHRGDTLGVTCTYDPKLRQELPQLRRQPPRFVVWGDGSSDEMCQAIIESIKAVPHP